MQRQASDEVTPPYWALRAVERAPSTQRSRAGGMRRARQVVDAARRLVETKGFGFTIQELVKEAGIAIQTFYNYFAGKDEVALAVIEDMVSASVADLEHGSRDLPDAVARLRYYIREVIVNLGRDPGGQGMGSFIAAEHWRLMQTFPTEVACAARPYTDLLARNLDEAARAGQLAPGDDVEYSAWLAAQMILAVYHHYAFTPQTEPYDAVADRVWAFCFAAWRDRTDTGPEPSGHDGS
ncbi:TetR/AcrR family transcriptional regulator [Streptomyces sp. NPDC090075]|uniref:TetR/AcrR family transcriptional regulator n=1 Tax=Streptomyces sp. NPDC090075 TaxID=3365937 RepID=UPI0037FDA9CA